MKYKLLLVLFLISFILQSVFIFTFKEDPLAADGSDYYEISQNILHKQASILGGYLNLRRPPVYPFLLAIIFFLFGNQLIAAQLFQAVLIALVPVIIYLLGRLIFNEKTAVIGAVLTCFNPVLLASSFYILTEALTIFLVTLAALLLTKAFLSEKKSLFLICGILIGIITLARPVLIVFPILILPLRAEHRKSL